MNTYVIDLNDRQGALERILNLCRRKGYRVQTLQFGPSDVPGLSRMVVAFEDGCPPADRVLPTLGRIHEIVSIQQVDANAHAVAATATLKLRTRAA